MIPTVDVIVIGGGATGAAALYDCARRGLQALLIEQGDLATGTSGRYHGLLHSGGRYAVRDRETAAECIAENTILRRIAPFAIEDTGGLFVATPDDPPDYPAQWVQACTAAGIPTDPISDPRRIEPALTPQIAAAYRIPDGSCDGFDLVHGFTEAARALGSDLWIYHRVIDLLREGDAVVGARVIDVRRGEEKTVLAGCILNAAGAWSGKIAALAGLDVSIRFDRGAMIAMNTRWANTVINRLRPATDGDILVPVGTVNILGTTSVITDHPDDHRIEDWEINRILDDMAAVVPGIKQGRALRAWAGVRPLYEPPEANHDQAVGRDVKRTFSVIDHAERDGLRGLVTVVGGKLTTCRLMAEAAVNVVAQQIGSTRPCTTAAEVLPGAKAGSYHHLQGRLDRLEGGDLPAELICECELVTRAQLEDAIRDYGDQPVALGQLRRDLRLGMGPCQAGFCGYRAAGLLMATKGISSPEATRALASFVNERYRGVRPLLWGHGLRQFYLDELIYRRTLGLDALTQEAES